MIRGRLAWLLAACAALLPLAPGMAKKGVPPPIVRAVSDEQLYKDAMECKVRVEALVPAVRNRRERKRVEHALSFWTAEERKIGARLGKSFGDMLKDEIFFGLDEGSNPGAVERAISCVDLAVAANRYR